MLPSYVLFGIFIILVYSLTHENRRYAATASALRQIWSGNCRLGCRPSFVSEGGISGLSGLVVPIDSDREDNSSQCVCESCPCALIENFLKCRHPDDIFDFSSLMEALQPPSPQAIADGCLCEICPCDLIKDIIEQCRPATQIYATVAAVVYYYYSLVYRAYKRMIRILECGISCQRQAQLVNPSSLYNSNENFTLVDKAQKSKQLKTSRLYLPSSSASALTKRSTSNSGIIKQSASFHGAPKQSSLSSAIPKQSGSSSAITKKEAGFEATSKFSSSNISSDTTPMTKSSGPSSVTPVSSSSAVIQPPSTSVKTSDTISREVQKTPKSMAELLESGLSDETLRPIDIAPGTELKINSCSKCVEEGKTCIGGCPSAEEKKKKKKLKN